MSPRCRGDVKRDVLGRQRRLFPANRRGACAFSVRDSHAATIYVAAGHVTRQRYTSPRDTSRGNDIRRPGTRHAATIYVATGHVTRQRYTSPRDTPRGNVSCSVTGVEKLWD